MYLNMCFIHFFIFINCLTTYSKTNFIFRNLKKKKSLKKEGKQISQDGCQKSELNGRFVFLNNVYINLLFFHVHNLFNKYL